MINLMQEYYGDHDPITTTRWAVRIAHKIIQLVTAGETAYFRYRASEATGSGFRSDKPKSKVRFLGCPPLVQI